jgi:carboxymethylenebutenolidase
MAETITLRAADGHEFEAYLAEPAKKPRAALLVVQEIFGVNHHIRRLTDDFARQGYRAISPALFDRVERHVELGYDQASMSSGREIRGRVPLTGTLADLQATIDHVKSAGKVGIVGYCWGGSLAFLAATRLAGLSAGVGYYGGMIAGHAEEHPKAPVMLHFGDKDQSIPLSDVDKIRAAHPDMPIHIYPAGHGFSCDERASFDQACSAVALERTLGFLASHLG